MQIEDHIWSDFEKKYKDKYLESSKSEAFLTYLRNSIESGLKKYAEQ